MAPVRHPRPSPTRDASTVVAAETRPPVASSVPGLTILWHPDPARAGERAPLGPFGGGRAVELSRTTPGFAPPGEGPPRPLADLFVSRSPLRLRAGRGAGGLRLERAGVTTPVEVDGAPLGESCDLSAEALGRGVVLLVAGRVALLLHRFSPIWDPGPDHGLVGASDAVVGLRREISRVAGLRVPVLLEGETGSGKELVALAIHRAGSGGRRPFLAVNMGAVPPSLAAAELFGSARGAYTGADRRRSGYFARADGGTLFLDEIGETPAEVQVLLLRALESGEIQPVGSEANESVDVRVVAATDADLAAAVAAGRFRSPLLNRLNGYPIRVPPLRERRDDLGRLLLHFLRREVAAMGDSTPLEDPGPRGRPWLPAPLVARLAGLDWPGNVRQLRNVVRQIAIAGRGAAEARPPASLLSGRAVAAAGAEVPAAVARRYRDPGEVGEAELVAAMERHRFRVAPAAADLGVSRTALYGLVDRCPTLRKAAELSRGEIEAARRRCGGDLAATAAELRVSLRGLQLRITALGAS